jgi:hypothetical protein
LLYSRYSELDSTKSPERQHALASGLIKTDDNGSGKDAPMPTRPESTPTRNGMGASFQTAWAQSVEGTMLQRGIPTL